MSERRPYSRIYWSVMDDPKFETVYGDDASFALWLRLLMTADALWPSAAPLPRGVKPKALARLVESGIVDLLDRDRYRIHGLDNEREGRQSVASASAHARWDRPLSERNADALPTQSESNASQAKPSQAKTETSQVLAEARDPADIYWSLTGRYPTDKVLRWVDDLTAQYGADSTIKAIADAHIADRSTSTLLGRAQDILRSGARQLDLKERTAEQKRIAEQRAKPKAEEPWRVEYRKAIEDHYRRDAA